jgi:EAL domain-containing protein (putative c-di-GMP-specific phosphodiesterase class I)
MDDQRPEDATKLAALPRHSAMPWVCVADPRQQMRTFLAETLQDLGCVTRECADVAELDAELDLRPPDLVVIGLAAGGIEACEMVDSLAAKEFDGKVLVLGPRVSPMVAAIRELGAKLGLAMLPLLPTPFSQADLRNRIAAVLAPNDVPATHSASAAVSSPIDSLELWYQPKIDTGTLALSAAEALAPIRHPTLGVMPPGYVMPDGDPPAREVSEIVIDQAINDWRYFTARHGHIEIAINLPINFFRDPELIERLYRRIPDHPAFEGLIVQVNAADVVRNLGLVKKVARLLRYRTIAVSIGDLGAEWPSLGGLDDFPFVELKVARQFFAGCDGDRRKQRACRRIIDLADAMGARTVADGVESRADFLAARELGFNLVQGTLFAKPMTAKNFARSVLGRQGPWPVA